MKTSLASESAAAPSCSHELRFASLHHPGRALAVPCTADGQVDLDALPRRLLVSYLGARALIGRDYAHPVVSCG